MRKLALAIFALALSVASATAQTLFPLPSLNVPITGTVAASTRIITAPAGKQIVITQLSLIPVATAAVQFTYGTGTNCGTGTGNLTGAMTFAAGQVLNTGSGNGPVLIVPQNNDVCVTIGTAAAPGFLVYSTLP